MTDPTPTPTDPPAGDPDDLHAGGLKALEAERKARKTAEQGLRAADERTRAMQEVEIERIAGEAADGGYRPLLYPADLWKGDVQLPDLLDETGRVDPAKVRQAVAKLIEERPHYTAHTPRVAGTADGGRGSSTEPDMDEIAARLIRGH